MIITYVTDPYLRAALAQAGHREEDVILDSAEADEALAWGYPRLVVLGDGSPRLVHFGDRSQVPSVRIGQRDLARWEAQRTEASVPGRVGFLAQRVRDLVESEATTVTWVDRTLGDLSRAAGAPLPVALRAFGRRVLEFPSHYDDLHPVAQRFGLSRGALKARFRRRGLPSPYAYLRWFRIMACAHLLSDRSVTVAQAATRLGYTSDGNLCRAMGSVTGLVPTEARTLHGWNRILITFAWTHLGPEARQAWEDLEDLFVRRVA